MKRVRQFLTVTVVCLLLAMVLLLIVPLPLTWWLPRAEGENTAWCCAVKIYDERPITELTAEETLPFVEALEQTKARFSGWSDGQIIYPYAQVFLCDRESSMRVSDVRTLSFDEQGLLIMDGMKFSLAEEQKIEFYEAFGKTCEIALAQKFKNS